MIISVGFFYIITSDLPQQQEQQRKHPSSSALLPGMSPLPQKDKASKKDEPVPEIDVASLKGYSSDELKAYDGTYVLILKSHCDL